MEPIGEEQQQVILDFVAESMETLESVEPTLIHLGEVSDIEEIKETMDLLFRPFHSLKGGAGFLNFTTIQKVTHSAENLLQVFRSDATRWESKYSEVLIQSCDLLSEMLNQVEEEFHEEGFEEDADELIRQLEDCLDELAQTEELESELSTSSLEQEVGSIPLSEVLSRSAALLRNLIKYSKDTFAEGIFYQEMGILVHELERHYTECVGSEPQTPEDLFPLPDKTASSDKTTSSANDSGEMVEILNASERLKQFITDTLEQLEKIEDIFLVLDKLGGEMDTKDYLDSAFRNFHSIKGNSGFLAVGPMENLSHKAEAVLEGMQAEEIPLDASNIQSILEVVDTLREGVVALSNQKSLNLERFEQALRRLTTLTSDPEKTKLGDILIEMGSVTSGDIEEAVQQQQSPLGDILVQMGKASPSDVEQALQKQSEKKKTGRKSASTAIAPKTQDIRVSLDKLDQLINLVGELVISETMVSQHPALKMKMTELKSLKKVSGQLHRNMRELQEIAMSMRMVPVSSVFRKMVRVVHDTSKKLGKQVELELVGEKSEVDKTLVEQIADPLLHIIRNAVDHGLETPEERQSAGKPPGGKIVLEAQHVGNEVWIIIQDDGKGMNREVILNKAIERGLISEDASPADEEVWKLILEPGFSTAQVVTDFSGRGVGMDVVKKNIEKLRGSVDVRSTMGKGSTFTLRIPLTLSIIDGLLVKVGRGFYVLPTTTIQETLQPEPEKITETMDGKEMLRIREKLLPIMRLDKVYQLQSHINGLSEGMVLVIDQANRRFCLLVDEVIGQQQVVVKSVPETMTHVEHLAGCTILGSGKVGLILDAASLAKKITYKQEKQNREQRVN